MVWIVILICMSFAIMPMIWVKQSPYQKKIAEFRKAARENGLSVRRCRRPDFREGENRLVSVCYEISTTYKEDDMKFCIHRVSNRGEESIWKSWRWASEKPNQKWNHLIEYVTNSSNDNVLALIVRPGSIGLVLDEKKVSEEIKFFKKILLNSKIKVDQSLMLQL